MKRLKNNIKKIPQLLLVVIIFLLSLTLFSIFYAGDGEFKRLNIVSDLLKGVYGEHGPMIEEREYVTADVVPADTVPLSPLIPDTTNITPPQPKNLFAAGDTSERTTYIGTFKNKKYHTATEPDTTMSASANEAFKTETVNIVHIEDYSDNRSELQAFYKALKNAKQLNRPVRIAFVGDSFIEGDILTSNLRETLQSVYGGRGVGFVPLAPISKYRNTLKQKYSNWQTFSMLNRSSVDPRRLIINGQYFVPKEGAYTELESTGVMKHSSKFDNATLLFSSDGVSRMTLKVNDTDKQVFETAGKTGLQAVKIEGEDIYSVRLDMEKSDGFVGYGFFLNDNTGVYVDNFSLRSSTGTTLALTDSKLLEELNGLIKYDLVILQYGLNIAEPRKTVYTDYRDKMINVVRHLKKSMPETSFLIFSVGDRNFKAEDGQVKTMPGIINMVETQREIAKGAKVAFWNTYQAMGGMNSMKTFVHNSPPLANKDYTHINFAGGGRIADMFATSLIEAAQRY